jgi:general secretion pathway protein G
MCLSSQLSAASRRHTSAAVRAFTLLEILVVLAIIGLLAGLAITNVDKLFGGAQQQAADIYVNQSMKTALTTYRIQIGDYPSTAEGLQALLTPPQNKASQWRGPYVEKLQLDPWKHPYQYAYPGTHNKGSYDLWSTGPDGENGTGDDIGNWDSTPAPENK